MHEVNSRIEQAKENAGTHGVGSRRHFVRGACAVIPVVLTVGSRSALANGGCLSPSASASINLLHSRPNRTDGSCALGRTPWYWQSAADTQNNLLARNTLFSTPFPGGFLGKTIEQVIIENGTQDPQQLGAHLGAAWCNLQMGWVDASVLSLEVLGKMWAGRISGYYPIDGALLPVWGPADIVTYLKTTMPL